MTLMISMFFGAVLGMRRSVFALYPAFVIAVAPIVGSAAMYGSSVWSTLLAMPLSAIGLQIGFLGGLATRFAWRLRRRQPSSALPGSAR
jgi:hypothetical protein